jgi:hypothetical protein
MTQPTLKDLAELAGMTIDGIRKLRYDINTERFEDMENADNKLALALIKARRDELYGMVHMMEHCSPKHAEAACDNRISTLTAALKAGGGE